MNDSSLARRSRCIAAAVQNDPDSSGNLRDAAELVRDFVLAVSVLSSVLWL